jgi:aldehyde:ferredoxin oxidoreductase
LSRELAKRSFGPDTAKYRELGTATNVETFNRFGTLPTRNFQRGTFEHAATLAPDRLRVEHAHTRESCVACTIGCEHIYAGTRVEYESLFALGSLCGVGDGDAVLRAIQRCDELGIDTISAGGTIAFAMECVERGLLDEPWLTFGSGEAVLEALESIGRREGVGRLLGEGSRRTALAIGHGSIAFAPQVKGLEIPGYEPRALQTMALGFAVGARGADHNRSGAYEVDFSGKVDRRHATRDSVRHAIDTEDRAALMDSLILCKFLRGVFTDFHAEAAEMLQAITGWDVTADELRDTARRILAAKREVNLLAGWTPEEDTLPDRFFDDPLPGDPAAILTRERLQELVSEYHRQRSDTRS